MRLTCTGEATRSTETFSLLCACQPQERESGHVLRYQLLEYTLHVIMTGMCHDVKTAAAKALEITGDSTGYSNNKFVDWYCMWTDSIKNRQGRANLPRILRGRMIFVFKSPR